MLTKFEVSASFSQRPCHLPVLRPVNGLLVVPGRRRETRGSLRRTSLPVVPRLTRPHRTLLADQVKPRQGPVLPPQAAMDPGILAQRRDPAVGLPHGNPHRPLRRARRSGPRCLLP